MSERSILPEAENAHEGLDLFMRALGPCAEDMTITPYARGNHNQIFVCEGGPPSFPEQFIVRYPTCPSAMRGLETSYDTRVKLLNELSVPQALHLGYLPFCGTPVMLEEFMPGIHLEFMKLQPCHIKSLAQSVAEFHARRSSCFSNVSGTEPTCSGTYADYARAMVNESVTERLQTIDMSRYPEVALLLSRGVDLLEDMLVKQEDDFAGSDFRLLHHDLNENNVLWRADDTAVLIDANPTWGDPADDLDYVCTDTGVDDTFRQALYDAYIECTGDTTVLARINAYTLKNRLDDLAWIVEIDSRQGEGMCKAALQQRMQALHMYVAQEEAATETS